MEVVQDKRVAFQRRDDARLRNVKHPRQFKVGDHVMVHSEPRSGDDLTSSFIHAWRGPYEVKERNVGGANIYRLQVTSDLARVGNHRYDNPIVHADRLKLDTRATTLLPSTPISLPSLLPFLGPKWGARHNNKCEFCATGGEVLCCDWCNAVYHKDCMNPLPIEWRSGDDWACPVCWHFKRYWSC